MNFRNALPEFYEEVRSLLVLIERNDLLGQLKNLEIVQRCPCTEIGCASFKVSGSSSPDTFEQPGPRRSTFTNSLDLNAERGKIILSTDPLGRITTFEVLNRPDVRRKLLRRY
jgi:hypothetical protein